MIVQLNPIEQKILSEIVNEYSSNDIAKKYNLSIMEVDKIRKDIMRKTGVSTMVGLLKYAMTNQ